MHPMKYVWNSHYRGHERGERQLVEGLQASQDMIRP